MCRSLSHIQEMSASLTQATLCKLNRLTLLEKTFLEKDRDIITPFIQALLGFDGEKMQDEKWEDEKRTAKQQNRAPDPNISKPLPLLHYKFARARVSFGTTRLFDKVDPIYRNLVEKEVESPKSVLMHMPLGETKR